MLVLHHTIEKLNNGLKVMLIWYDMAYLSIKGTNLVFLWYDMAYLIKNGTKSCFYGMIQYTLVIMAHSCVFVVWYNTP